MDGIDVKSVTSEELEGKYVPLINTIGELIISHPDIPENVEQSDLLGSLTMLTNELRNEVNGRVPEFVRLQDKIAKQETQIRKLQETNQQLFLKAGAVPDPNKKPDDDKPPRKTMAEIKAMLDKL